MKNKKIRRAAMVTAVAMLAVLTACGQTESKDGKETGDRAYRFGGGKYDRRHAGDWRSLSENA